jgi:hypothetical protein
VAEMDPASVSASASGDPMAECPPAAAAAEGSDAMDCGGGGRSNARVAGVLRGFLAVQQRRAEAYSTLRRYILYYLAACWVRATCAVPPLKP